MCFLLNFLFKKIPYDFYRWLKLGEVYISLVFQCIIHVHYFSKFKFFVFFHGRKFWDARKIFFRKFFNFKLKTIQLDVWKVSSRIIIEHPFWKFLNYLFVCVHESAEATAFKFFPLFLAIWIIINFLWIKQTTKICSCSNRAFLVQLYKFK